MRRIVGCLLWGAIAMTGITLSARGADDLIPREALFGNPDRAAARISRDGKRLAWLAPVDGVLNIWVAPLEDLESARPITKDTKRGIRSYFWAYTDEHILYTQDNNGDENWHVYAVSLEDDEVRDLTPLDKVRAEIDSVSDRFPTTIVVGLNDRDEQFHDLYKLDITTGERTLLQKNEEFLGFVLDEDYRVRFASKYTADGGTVLMQADGDSWTEFARVPQEDSLTTNTLGFDKTGDILYFMDSRGRDTAALIKLNLKTDEKTIVAEDERADVGGIMAHPTEQTIQAVSFTYARKEWTVLDPAVEIDLKYLRSIADGDIEVPSRTLDDKQWIVAYLMDNGPIRYYHYDRRTKKARFLFTNRSDLENLPLAKMHDEVIESRDGLKLVCYLTLPKDADQDGDARPDKPLPMVLNVHGGPWARDTWGYDPEHQLFANRGYAVLSVNFRGSTGFGKKFLNSGNKEWAGKMHEDLLDAVEWAVGEKIADPKKVAIMGGSYGGYATLVGLTFTPDTFACGVDIVGPSNILTLLATIPAYWQPAIQQFTTRVGDHTTEEGKAFLAERSPLSHVAKINKPLLIGQGANDPRVKQSEADQIVAAMQEKKIPVTYVLYPDEGHGFARPANNLSFMAVTEAFYAEHLGGRAEPIGDAFQGSSITVPAGAEQIAGLEQALPKPEGKKPAKTRPAASKPTVKPAKPKGKP
ncbi:MAG: alpha/beta fold hydrolase [Pirellulales bacterium]